MSEDDDYVFALLDEIKRDEDTIMHEPIAHRDVEFYLERIEANKAEIRRVRQEERRRFGVVRSVS